MWRINNFLLFIFLTGCILVGGITFGGFLWWQVENWLGGSKQQQRELDAEIATNEAGQHLRTHAISYSELIEADEWGPWSVVIIQQASVETPIELEDASGAIGFERKLSERGADRAGSYGMSLYPRFANNIVIRNSQTHEELTLFDHKAAIVRMLPIDNVTSPALAILYADADTNSDGKLNGNDHLQLRHFRFGGSVSDIPFEGIAPSFLGYETDAKVFRMTTRRDLNDDGKVQEDFEPAMLYEIDVETGAIRTALSAETVDRLQAILDGAVSD
ncbi:MAG: hypothetical protein R3C58_06560 [Parvularculaceae bacterium]